MERGKVSAGNVRDFALENVDQQVQALRVNSVLMSAGLLGVCDDKWKAIWRIRGLEDWKYRKKQQGAFCHLDPHTCRLSDAISVTIFVSTSLRQLAADKIKSKPCQSSFPPFDMLQYSSRSKRSLHFVTICDLSVIGTRRLTSCSFEGRYVGNISPTLYIPACDSHKFV